MSVINIFKKYWTVFKMKVMISIDLLIILRYLNLYSIYEHLAMYYYN